MLFYISFIILALGLCMSPVRAEDDKDIELGGYQLSCAGNPIVYHLDHPGWREVLTVLPRHGMYLLDGNFIGYSMCDLVTCKPLPSHPTVSITEYLDEGTTPMMEPGVSDDKVHDVKVYKSTRLRGDIAVLYINRYADAECKTSEPRLIHFTVPQE